MLHSMSHIESNLQLDVFLNPGVTPFSKIICTIGPSCQTVDNIKRLITAGMDVARINMSYGDRDLHLKMIKNIQQASKETNKPIAIAMATKGPEIRCGEFIDHKEVKMTAGASCILTVDESYKCKGTACKFYVDYFNLPAILQPGIRIYLDDGNLGLDVQEIISATDIRCTVYNEHVLGDRKVINLPLFKLALPTVSEKDREDLRFAVEQKFDFVFASFVSSVEHITTINNVLNSYRNTEEAVQGVNPHIVRVFAKVATKKGCENINSIIQAASGVIIARGYLGVEIPIEKVFEAQKMIIAKCNIAGKPVVCTTQLLESMTHNFRPTRAEVSDVANAVLDGADCLMLSAETAKGLYPVEAVNYMNRISRTAQSIINYEVLTKAIKDAQTHPLDTEEAICAAAVQTAAELNAKAIIAITQIGRCPQFISKYRPSAPILGVTRSEDVCRAMCVLYGVVPLFYDEEKLGEDPLRQKRVEFAMDYGKSVGMFKPGNIVVVIHRDGAEKGIANMTRGVYVR